MASRALVKASLAVALLAAVSFVSAAASAQSGGDPPPLPPAGPTAPGTAEPAPALPPPSTGPGPSQPEAQPAATTATPPAAPAVEPPAEETAGLRPMHLDFRGTINADVLLAYIGLGLSADLGLVPVGPGTLAVGAGFEYDFCGSVCWFFSAVTPLDFSHRQIWPQARASYHLGLKSAKHLDLYPFVGLGPVFARSEISVDSGAARYVGTDTSIGVNFGAGASLFVAGPVFVGGEARIRYAAGDYNYRLESGDGTRTYDRGSVETWSLTGIDVLVAVGVRLP